MANQLKMAEQHVIIRLAENGWSYRRIARELGIHRETVARYVALARVERQQEALAGPPPPDRGAGPFVSNRDGPIAVVGSMAGDDPALSDRSSKPAISMTGLQAAEPCPFDVELPVGERFDGQDSLTTDCRSGPKPAISIAGSAGRRSHCEPYRAVILEALERGLTAQRIWQDLRADHGFNESYQSVQRFVRRLRTIRPLPFRRMECDPGAEAQIDFGAGAPVISPIDPNQPNGKTRRRRTHVIRIVLSHSRKAYSEAVYRQTTDDFIRCLENAFHHFGGVPKTLVVDNLKAAVTQADWYDPVINPKIAAFCEHYGTILLPTKPYTPWHKGKVERQVGYVKNNGLKGRSFASLEDENAYLLHWEETIADTRIHGTTKKQVGKVFEEVERSALRPLPIERFACFREAQRRVHRDGHVEVDKAYYSVPPEYVGRQVWARWDGRVVRIFNDRIVQIAIHARHEAGRFSTQSQHIAHEKIAGVERGTTALLRKVRLIGVHSSRWAESMLSVRGIPGIRVLVGLGALAHRHSSSAIEQACEIAQTHGAYHLRSIRELIKRTAPRQEQFEFIERHPIIRSISEYGSLVRRALRHELAPCICTDQESAAADSPKTPIPFASFPSPLIGEPLP